MNSGLTRRGFLKGLGAAAMTPTWLAAQQLISSGARQKPTNIVLFLADDLGWQDTSVPFYTEVTASNRLFHTPNMMAVAREGMKFTQAYACAVCTPSRVSLITGQNAARHRVTDWVLRRDGHREIDGAALRAPEWNVNGLSPVPGIPHTVCAPTLPSLLGEAGYRSIHIGKAHFAALGTPGEDPLALGFDVNVGGHAAGGPGSYLGTRNFSAAWRGGDPIWDVPGLEQYHGQNIFLTEALTLEANKAVDRAVADGVPFFLYMSHYAPHVPYAPDERFYQKYRDAGLGKKEAMYAALVEGLDKSLGDIMANLERHGIAENTLVLVYSDNGGLSTGARGGQPHTQNRPLKSGKGSVYEGGIRVPLIARWPGVVAPGTVCSRYVMIEDFFPTLLDVTGARAPVSPVDGHSFVPLIRQGGEYDTRRPLLWHYPHYWGPEGPGIRPYSALRRGDWKLIYFHDDRSIELYDLWNDIGEAHELTALKPVINRRLAATLGDHLQALQAQMPIDKATGQPIALPGRA